MRQAMIALALVLVLFPVMSRAHGLDPDRTRLLDQFKDATFTLLEINTALRAFNKTLPPDAPHAANLAELYTISVEAYMATQHVCDMMTMFQALSEQDTPLDKMAPLSQSINLRGYLYFMLADGWRLRTASLMRGLPDAYRLKYDKMLATLVNTIELFHGCTIFEKIK